MLWEAERRLRDPIDDTFISNVLLECFGVHLRLVVDFLYKPAKYGDDVSSDHFVADLSDWHKARGNLHPALLAAVRRADKQLVHLTFKRYRGAAPQKRWTPRRLCDLVRPALKSFRAHALNRRLHPKTRTRIDDL